MPAKGFATTLTRKMERQNDSERQDKEDRERKEESMSCQQGVEKPSGQKQG